MKKLHRTNYFFFPDCQNNKYNSRQILMLPSVFSGKQLVQKVKFHHFQLSTFLGCSFCCLPSPVQIFIKQNMQSNTLKDPDIIFFPATSSCFSSKSVSYSFISTTSQGLTALYLCAKERKGPHQCSSYQPHQSKENCCSIHL